MLVLGIETSCDETAAAVVEADPKPGTPVGRIRSNAIYAQLGEHQPFGGVVPEIAARAHVERIDGLIRLVMEEAGESWDRLSGIAATAGPGLIGGVMVGLSTAKAIALARGLPLSIFTADLFTTGNDEDNRAAVRAVAGDALDLVGLSVHGPRNAVDKIVKGARMHP